MDYMFYNCSGLTTLDVSNWDTSNVTDMGGMFSGLDNNPPMKLTTIDVSNWNVSNVTNFGYMFQEGNWEYLDVSKWDTSKATSMHAMFRDCPKLDNLDVSHFNTSNVQDMYGMFNRDTSLTKLDLSKWDISKLINNVHWLVESCSNLTTVGDISKWNISGVGACRAFAGCPKLTTLGPIDTSSEWQTAPGNTGEMFADSPISPLPVWYKK